MTTGKEWYLSNGVTRWAPPSPVNPASSATVVIDCHEVLPEMLWKMHGLTWEYSCQEMVNLNLIMRKQADKSRLWDILLGNWLGLFKNVNVMKARPKKEKNLGG